MIKRTERLLQEAGVEPRPLEERQPLMPRRPVGEHIVVSPKIGVPVVNQIRYRNSTERKMREGVIKKIPWLLKMYFQFDPMPFHVEVLRLMFEGGKLVINLPTDHAKSMLSSYWFPILSLMNDPNESHIICGANLQDSTRRVAMVRSALEPGGFVGPGVSNEDLLRDFPWIAKPNKKDIQWSSSELSVVGRETNKPNPSIRAVAAGSADIRGRRGKLIMDDLEGAKHRKSPSEREKLYDFIKLEAIRCFEDSHESSRPLICALGTPFDSQSIYFKLQSQGWGVRRWPYKKEDGSYLWPAKHDKIREFRKSMTKQEFSIAFEMDPSGGDESALSLQQIEQMAADGIGPQDGSEMPICQACGGSGKVMSWDRGRLMWMRCSECEGRSVVVSPVVLVVLDPASGSKTKRADYAGLAVERIMWVYGEDLPRVEVLEAHKFTLGIYEQVSAASNLSKRYECDVVYEANGQQGNNYASVKRKMLESGEIPESTWHRFYTTSQNKNWDVKLDPTIMRSLLVSKRLMIPASRHADEGVQALFTEIMDYGSGGHDHILMALWMGIRWAYEHKNMDKMRKRSLFAPSVAQEYFQSSRGFIPTRRFGWR